MKGWGMVRFANGGTNAKQRTAVSIVAFLLAGVAFLPAQPSPPPDVKQLVQAVIDNELENSHRDQSRWMYRLQKQDGDNASVNEVIETKDCDIHLLLSLNGEPLTPDQRLKENERLVKLANDPEEQRKKKHEQQEDDRKAVEMFKMLPEAFLYHYRGNQGSLVELAFQPNPNFHPATREAQVFHGMEGSMWVDAEKKRLQEFDGHLVQDVVFFGGLLGHLEKGGSFTVKRAELAPGEWMITELNVEVKGKALLFKSINLRQRNSMTDFRQVPPDLNATRAADMLRTAGFAEGTRELADSDRRNRVTR
jgi:hypothetical protein